MTGSYKHAHQATFECVDRNPEYLAGQGANTNGAQFHFVRPDCPYGAYCPPYVADREITCVVCTR